MEELNRNAKELWRIQREVEEEVKKAKEAGKEFDEEATKWLEKVKKISGNMKDKRDGKVETNMIVHNMKEWFSSNNQSKSNSSQDVLEVKTLVDEGKSVLTVCFPVDSTGIEDVWRAGFVKFNSRRFEYNRIMEGLRDEEVGLIGTCGMGGMGKTKLVEEIGMNAKKLEILFDHVVIATVSQEVDIRNIQGIFADMLNLTFKKNTESGRAYELREKLEKESKILVILDDVWEKINMESIGVPVYSNHKGCKIILTTRREEVCDDMGCSLIVRLGKIDDNEAMGLFIKSAELIYKIPGELIKSTKKIVKECAGLPLAIVTVGRALRGRSPDEFEDAALKLSNSSYVDIQDADKDVYACLKLSYDYLREKDVQNCLLLCSLYPEDSMIMVEELVRYSYGLWLFEKVESVDEARQKIIKSVEILEKASLLSQHKPLDPDPFLEQHCVKMHDVVRDVALWIAKKEYGPFIVVNSFKELKKKMSENAFAVSLTSPYYYNGESSPEPEEVCFPATLKLVRLHLKSKKWPGQLFK
ncbi:disease resistance protein At4g27190-like [Beta vulgaris subsp. vulgaris]|uniref:disease resistance protein At4g27190-like n=1 Tax=Beta vulgaris subsp. vulgaris TaxID=3555 RepID=UPI00254737D7|nr:disease resistance protein At4g27190-like [Beta vulgaris subsp. vulgaris]